MLEDVDLCIGYIGHPHGHRGVSGSCCCGLYWEHRMPPHDPKGRLIAPTVIERVRRRRARRAEARARRKRERRELGELGAPVPFRMRRAG